MRCVAASALFVLLGGAATPAAGQACSAAADSLATEGWAAYREDDMERAAGRFSDAVQRCPDHLGATVGLGYARLRQGDVGAAERRFRAALDIDAGSVDALAGLGLVAWRRGDLEDVERHFRRVLDLDPDHTEARAYLDRVPAGLGEPPPRPPLVLPDTLAYPARVHGDGFQVRTSDGWRPFYVRGVNLGAALPGRHASQFPDSATYARWIGEMADMGANAVRVYTIHPPHFYAALAAHNRTTDGQPLRLIHGAWTELPPEHDFQDPRWEGEFLRELERVVDVIHGRADVRPRPGHAAGFYTADVSEWTLAYIIGREWEPYAIAGFNAMRPAETTFDGRYLAVDGGRPADVWMARAMEHMVAYETRTYGVQRPIAYTNWPTLDPLHHPTEATVPEELAIRRALGERVRRTPLEYDNDTTSLDAMRVRATDRFPAGHFASYHAYPYYPDFVMVSPEYAGARSPYGASSYFGYLEDLKAHHAGVPVVISEYGVPTGFGYAHLHPQGFHHGGLDERRMAEVDARLTREIAGAGMAGGVIFAWIDEWFKKNWITTEFELPPDRNRLWYNRLDAEQHYGMFAYEAEPAVPGESMEDRRAAWRSVPALHEGRAGAVRAAADAAYLWLLVEPPPGAQELVLGFDVVGPAGIGNRRLPGVPESYGVGFEFALRLADDEVRLTAAPGYNPFRVLPVGSQSRATARPTPPIADPPAGLFTGRFEMELGRPLRPEARADGVYEPLRVIPNRRRFGRDSTEFPAIGYDRGLLPRGPDPDGLWARFPDGAFEVRVPWGLLNVTDPSQRRVALESDTAGAIGTITIDAIGMAGAARVDGGWLRWPGDDTAVPFRWDTWDEPRWRVRERPAYRLMRETFRDLDGPVVSLGSAPQDPAAPDAVAPPDPDATELATIPDPAAADSAWHAGDTDLAERLYAEVLAEDSTHYAALHRMALIHAWEERYDDSLRLFDRLLRLYPSSVDARIDRARVLAWRGDVDPALAAIDAVLAEDPGNTAALEALAQFQSWAGRYDQALDAYSRLARLDPGHESLPYDRARVLALASRFEAASVVYDSILAERPDDVDALAGRARALLWAGRTDEAAATYQRLLDVEPDNLDALRGLAQAAAWSGDLRLAERRWRAVLATEPDDVAASVGLSRTLRWQGRDADALAAARRAVELDPTSAEARAELRAARVPFAPFAAPSVARESDSDGNRITTASAMARFRPVSPLSLRVDAYVREASERSAAADLEQHARGATLTGSWQVGAGWGVSGTVGASVTDAASRAVPTYAVGLASPGGDPVRGNLSLRSQAFDATARLIERRVEMTELSANVRARITGSTELSAAAGSAWFLGRVSDQENHRWSAYLSASHRLGTPFTLGATTRMFGFRHDLADGYFDPDLFALAEILARWQQGLGPVELSLEAAPGLQKVRTDGDTRPVGRVAGNLTWGIAVGRELAIGALFANAGLERLSAGEDTDYEYHAITARLSWSF